jgi:hypothetical protein
VASRAQITRLAERIEGLVARSTPQGPFEHWNVEGNKAWQSANPQHAITFAELEARPTTGIRIVSRYVHAENGGPAACCSVGGACYALHGPVTNV